MGKERTCLLVVGMHRSGTSAISGTLALLGGGLPLDELGATASNVKGHFEPRGVLEVTKELLMELDTCWYDFGPIDLTERPPALNGQFRAKLGSAIRGSFGEAPFIVLKDPRISRFIPLVCSALEDVGSSPYAIICSRNPLEVARSLKARNGISAFHGCNLWLRYMLDAEYGTRGLPRAFVDFSSFMDDWRSTIERIERQLGTSIANGSADLGKVDDFLDGDLQHERVGVEELERDFGKHSLLYRCYEGLENLSHNPNDRHTAEMLDEIRSSFNEQTLLFSGTIKDYFCEISNTRKVLRDSEKKLRRLEKERNKVSDLKKSRKKLQSKIGVMTEELGDATRNGQLEASVLQRRLDAVYSSTSWRLTAPLRYAAALLRKLTH